VKHNLDAIEKVEQLRGIANVTVDGFKERIAGEMSEVLGFPR
jgi:hypothetical protein